MNQLENVKFIASYAYDSEHYIDIIDTDDTYEAWLYKRDCGFKSFMFGVPTAQNSKEEFLQIVTANILQYIPMYYEELRILEEDR